MKNCNDAKYQIEIYVKDGKYKFEIVSLSDYVKPSRYISGGWNTTSNMSKFASNCYKNNGEIKGMCKDLVIDIPGFLNSLNKQLINYIDNPVKNSAW